MCDGGIFGSQTKKVVAITYKAINLLGAPGTRLWKQTGEKRGSRSEGGTNLAKMIKIGTANGCSPPVSNQNTTHNNWRAY